jgi:DNA-binding NtrC family response regulator
MERPLALVVDRDAGERGKARVLLAEAGIEALEAGSGAEALELLRTRSVRIAILDPGTPGVLAADFLSRALRARPSLVPLILAASAATPEAQRLLDDGAYDLLDRALDPGKVRVVAARALSRNKLLEDLAGLREQLRSRTGYGKMVGRSAAMEQVRERLERQAASNAAVHFEGEDGVGRELAARTMHGMSARSGAPFATLDCASLRGTALETEIFGHDGIGSAGERRACGLIEGAAGGAIFLRTVDALPDAVQKRLAEALREGRVRSSGAGHAVPIDVRLYSSSVKPIDAGALGAGVCEELRAAMAATVIPVPALRKRREDIALLARHFLDAIREINELPELTLSPDALRVLEGHAWPGNVRELRNAVEHAVIVATEHTIRPGDLPGGVQEEPGETSASRPFRDAKRDVVDSFERAYLSDLLAQHHGNVTAAAHQAGMLRSALQRLLRKHDLRSMDFRGGSRPRGSETPS